jgi:hypothetical protein
MKVLVLGIGLLVAHGLSADVFNFAYDWEDGQYSVGYTHPRTPAHLPPGEGGSGYYGPGFHLTAVDNVSSGVEALWGDVSSNTVTPASGSQMLTFTAYSETGGGSPGTVYLSGLTGLNAGDSVNVSLSAWDSTIDDATYLQLAGYALAGTTYVSSYTNQFEKTAVQGWQTLSAVYVVPEGANTISIELREGSDWGTTYFVDNLAISVTTESTSATLRMPNEYIDDLSAVPEASHTVFYLAWICGVWAILRRR